MRLLFKLALRNILRNKKRSLITISAISFGLGALIFLRSFIFGAQTQMIQNITATLTSDAQIVPTSLENIYNTNGVIDDPESIRVLLREDSRILGFAERILGGGLISSENDSMATFIVGFDPDQETAIKSRRSAVQGRLMNASDTASAAIGEKMRQVLKLNIGDKIVVTAQDYYGSMAGGQYTLVGTFSTGNDQIDNGTVMLLKQTAQQLLSYDQKVSKFALHIDPRFSITDVVHDLRDKILGKDLKVLTWEELIPMLAQMIHFQNGLIFVIVLVVLTVVAAGILNTLMMSIIERIREFGLMMALGTQASQIVLLVVCESLLLTLLGSVVGVTLGVGLTLYFGHTGIDLSGFVSTLSNFLIGSHVYPRVDWHYLRLFLLVVLTSNLSVACYPAWKAARLVPVEAMRQVG